MTPEPMASPDCPRLVTSTTEGCTWLATLMMVCCKSVTLGGKVTLEDVLAGVLEVFDELSISARPTPKLPTISTSNSTAPITYAFQERRRGGCFPPPTLV